MKFLTSVLTMAIGMSLSFPAFSQEGVNPYLRVFESGKQGLMNLAGEIEVDIIYDYVDIDFNDGLARFRKGDKFGYIDIDGEEVIPPSLDGAADFHERSALIIKDGRYGFIDTRGSYIHEPQYDSVGQFSSNFLKVAADGKYGLIHRNGRVLLRCEYDYISLLTPGEWDYFSRYYGYETNDRFVVANVRRDGQHYGYMYLLDGTPVKEGMSGELDRFYDGLAVYEIQGRSGYIDMNGRIAIIPQYADARPFKRGYAWVQGADGWGVIDKSGNVVLPFSYPSCYFSRNGFVEIRTEGNAYRGIATYRGEIIVPAEYGTVRSYGDYFYAVEEGNGGFDHVTVYDESGNRLGEFDGASFNFFDDFLSYKDIASGMTVLSKPDGSRRLETRYDNIRSIGRLSYDGESTAGAETGDTLYQFRENRLYGIISGDLEIRTPAEYTSVISVRENFVRVQTSAGRETLRFRNGSVRAYPYDSMSHFSDTVLKVTRNDKIGFVRKSDGSTVTPPSIDRVWELSEGLAVFAINHTRGNLNNSGDIKFDLSTNRGHDDGDFGYIDSNGEIVIPAIFDCAYEFREGLAVVRFGGFHTGKRGYINADGTMVISPSFSYAYSFENGIACVIVDEKPGYIDRTGEYIFGPSL